MSNCMLGHSDNRIGFGSGISDLGYFRYVKIVTDRVFIKLGSDLVRYFLDPDNFGYIRSNCRKFGSGSGLAVLSEQIQNGCFLLDLSEYSNQL